jgi:predicted ATPase
VEHAIAASQPSSFAALLRRYRLGAGLTQEQLADRARLSAGAIGALERGLRRIPHRDTLALLADALGLPPDERVVLEASARRPCTAASTTASTSDPASRPPGNLPTPLTPLVGREREEAAAAHLLRRQDVRLLTLTGAPGIGKTRLALQVAVDLADDAPDGVYLVELAPITKPALVLPAIMRALGVGEIGGAPDDPFVALAAHLHARRVLLLLDNCERVAAAAAPVAQLLQACPGLRVLATSRVPLRLHGEHRLAVPPLALPDPTASPSVAEPSQYAAVALFVQRARAVAPTFALTAAQAPVVAAICQRLDGLPLAIELAAAWTRLLTPAALLARLERRLPLLEARGGDLPERQRTVRGAIAWSHDLLAPAERALLRRLAAFSGGWTLETAEAACGETGLTEAVLPTLAALVDAGLVERQEGPNGECHFRLLELVREFALERPEASGEAGAAQARLDLAPHR